MVLAKYNAITPGLAERIIAMAEKEAAHRHDYEKEIIKSEYAGEKKGQDCALIIGVVAILSGSVTAIFGAPWPGGFIGAGGVIGLVSIFVLGKDAKRKK